MQHVLRTVEHGVSMRDTYPADRVAATFADTEYAAAMSAARALCVRTYRDATGHTFTVSEAQYISDVPADIALCDRISESSLVEVTSYAIVVSQKDLLLYV